MDSELCAKCLIQNNLTQNQVLAENILHFNPLYLNLKDHMLYSAYSTVNGKLIKLVLRTSIHREESNILECLNPVVRDKCGEYIGFNIVLPPLLSYRFPVAKSIILKYDRNINVMSLTPSAIKRSLINQRSTISSDDKIYFSSYSTSEETLALDVKILAIETSNRYLVGDQTQIIVMDSLFCAPNIHRHFGDISYQCTNYEQDFRTTLHRYIQALCNYPCKHERPISAKSNCRSNSLYIEPVTSVIVSGSSGNGKTCLILDSCRQLDVHVVYITTGALQVASQGSGHEVLRLLLLSAIACEPCVVLFDDLDRLIACSGPRHTPQHQNQHQSSSNEGSQTSMVQIILDFINFLSHSHTLATHTEKRNACTSEGDIHQRASEASSGYGCSIMVVGVCQDISIIPRSIVEAFADHIDVPLPHLMQRRAIAQGIASSIWPWIQVPTTGTGRQT